MKLTSVRKVIHELAHRNMPLAATVVEVVDQLERRHNLARGVFDVTTMTGKTWKEIFAEMPDFIYNDVTKSYYIYDPEAYDAKSASKNKKKKVTRTKKVMSDDDLLDLEFEKMTMGKTITMEELERRRAAALLREREERKEFKESRRGFAGVIPKIVAPIIEEEEEEQ